VRHAQNVPASLLALILALGLAMGTTACGGDAESAGDLDSQPVTEEPTDATWDDQTPAPGAVTPAPSQPSTRQPPATTRPGQTLTPPPVEPSRPQPDLPEIVSPQPEEEPVTGTMLPVGTQMTGVMESTLSTQMSQVGDVFYARLSEALVGSDGTEWIPAGARLEGRVIESRESPSAREEAVLMLQIVALDINGERYPIQATVTRTEVATEARDSGQRTAATVATGAAAGAIVGQILGRDTRSTVVGAAVGAAAGAGIALTTRDGHATLAENSLITVRLDQAVLVAQR
jgi:hypothetical protein